MPLLEEKDVPLDFSSLKTLSDLLYRPRRASRQLRNKPRWLGVFLCLALSSSVLYGIRYESQINSVVLHLPGSADSGAREQIRQTLRDDLWRECLFLPYRLALGWGGFACLLYLSGIALRHGHTAGYRHVLALEVHAEVILLFPALNSLAGLPIPSLLLLFPGANRGFLLDSLLPAVNFFTLWYVLTLSVGMAVLFELRHRAALLVVAVCWGLSECLNAGVLNLLIRSFHFQP